jgi:hypothetical protein
MGSPSGSAMTTPSGIGAPSGIPVVNAGEVSDAGSCPIMGAGGGTSSWLTTGVSVGIGGRATKG